MTTILTIGLASYAGYRRGWRTCSLVSTANLSFAEGDVGSMSRIDNEQSMVSRV